MPKFKIESVPGSTAEVNALIAEARREERDRCIRIIRSFTDQFGHVDIDVIVKRIQSGK